MHDEIILMSPDRIGRSLKRIALQIWEDLGDVQNPLLIGLNERGYATAKIISDYLNEITGCNPELVRYDVAGSEFNGDEPDLENRNVILIDDVIFSAQTMFHAILDIFKTQLPNDLKVAVLVDRGHRSYPVEASYVGVNIPTKLKERVDLLLTNHLPDKVLLTTHE